MATRISCRHCALAVLRFLSLGMAVIAAAEAVAQGGDNCASAAQITSLPFVDVGNTSLFANDYALACVFGEASDSHARDVVYRYTPQQDELVTISLCGSGFDTELFVFEGSCPDESNPIACSDDDCFGSDGRTFASHLDGVALSAGVTYYIVIDGFVNAHGMYIVTMSSSFCADCPDGATLEDEPNCGLGDDGLPDDFINGGCNSTEPVFSSIADSETVCGVTASNPDTGARDTDWYEFVLTEPRIVTWLVTAEFRTLIGIVDNGGIADCTDVDCFVTFTETAECQENYVSALLGSGTWWVYVAPFFQDEADCEFPYTATLLTLQPADLNGDGVVDSSDLLILLAFWGPCPDPPTACTPDLDFDGNVGASDLLILLSSWG